MRRFVSYLLSVSLLIPLVNAFSTFMPAVRAQDAVASRPDIEAGIQKLKSATNGAAIVTVHPATGAARFVRMSSGRTSEAHFAGGQGTTAARSDDFFRNYGSAFGITNAAAELKASREYRDAQGGAHLDYEQVYKGVPVFAGLMKTHFDAEGNLRVINGIFIPGIKVNPVPSRSSAQVADAAITTVASDAQPESAGVRSGAPLFVRKSTLYIFRAGLSQGVPGENHLAWEIEVTNGQDVREFVYMDAHSGKFIARITGIHDAMNRRAFDGQASPQATPPNYPNNPFWVEGQAFPTGTQEADNMIISSKEVYDFFNKAFGRDSIDGAGGTMDAIFNRGNACPNASWNGVFISFCPGYTTDDVTAHEWGHAYTTYTDALLYHWQPGALNEAYSDIWGETIDRINGRDTIGNSATDAARTADTCTTHGPGIGKLDINTPASIAGTYAAQPAQFGPSLSATGPVTKDVVVATDAADAGGPSTTDGCSAITNPAAVAGKIALIDRGTCNFSVKVFNAQQAGATAVVIANNAAVGLPGMAAGTNAELVTIPSMGITKSEGDKLKANIATPPNVTLRETTNASDDSTRWLIGEDITPTGALRDMWSPNCYGNPAKVSDTAYYSCGPDTAAGDNGGVHINSGVPNHAYALLVDGGTYNGQTVNAIGLIKAAHIYYRAMTVYQHKATDFVDHADALEQSATDLLGVNLKDLSTGQPSGEVITAADIDQIEKAMLAVEMRLPPTQCNFQPLLEQNPPADSCSTGIQRSIFADDFEGDTSAWTISHEAVVPAVFNQPDWTVEHTLPSRTGSAFFAANLDTGNCSPAANQAGVRSLTSPTIHIPSTVTAPTLRYEEWMGSESGFDGGQLMVSVNGGAFTLVPFQNAVFNGPNVLLLSAAQGNTNPRAGQAALSGSDGGSVGGSWGTTIWDLSGIATPGSDIQLRWDFSNDCGSGLYGWYVDNIKLSACLADVDTGVANAASSNRVLIGDEVTYTIQATNNGPGLATSVKVVDTFSNGQFVSAMVSQGSVSQNGNTVTANFGDIASGGSATLTVVVKAINAGKLSNTAVVSQFEPDTTVTANNTDTEITRVVTAKRLDFSLGKVTGGCGTSTGTFKLSEVAPAGGVVIDLASADPSVSVPAQVTVPGGQQGVTFTATTSAVNTQRTVNITATLHDEPAVHVVGRLTLLPTRVSNLTFSPASPVHSGTPVTATVTLSCASSQNTTVKILTNKGAAKPTVSQIIIPAGQTSGQFTINTNSNHRTVNALITVVSNGANLQRPLTVIP